MNCAIYFKKSILRYFIRAIDLNALFEAESDRIELKGIPAFKNNCIYESKSEDFTPSVDLKKAYLNFLEASVDGVSKQDRERLDRAFGTVF